MKKILYLMALVAVMFAGVSCTDSNDGSNGLGFVYSVTVDGDADGSVDVTFPNGSLDLNGDADLAFVYSNDTSKTLANALVLVPEQVLESGTQRQLQALGRVNDWVDEQFNAAAASGTYYVALDGTVKETLTGLTFEVHRVFTNRADSTQVQ